MRLTNAEKEIKELKVKIERANLGVSRFENANNDVRDFNYEGYYTDMIDTMGSRVELMQEINRTDEQQAHA